MNLFKHSRIVSQFYREIIRASEILCDWRPYTPRSSDLLSSRYVPYAFTFVPLSEQCAVYTRCASNRRPFQAWLYDHHHGNHTMLLEEPLPCATVDLSITRDREFVTINSNTRTDSEVHVVRVEDLLTGHWEVVRVRERREFIEYYLDHAHDQFYVFTNSVPSREYQVMTASSDNVHSWSYYYSPPSGTVLMDMEIYEGGVLLYGRENCVPVAIALRPGHSSLTLVGEGFTDVRGGAAYTTTLWPVSFSSPVTPPTTLTLSHTTLPPSLLTEDRQLVSTESKDYCVERRYVTSLDGVDVPLTLIYKRNRDPNQTSPLLMHVYGCYGECVHTGGSPEGIPLLERGWVLGFAHVRGGGEKGRQWYYDGRAEHKLNTLQDLWACVCEVQCDISEPSLTALCGRSAGGLVVAMFCNLWPHLIQAAILHAPLVNLPATLTHDPDNYLANKDVQEFGNHITYMCPYSTLRPQDYPSMFVSASPEDEVIPYTGVLQYLTKLRQCSKAHVVFYRTNGSHDNNDVHQRSTTAAKALAFLHTELNLDPGLNVL